MMDAAVSLSGASSGKMGEEGKFVEENMDPDSSRDRDEVIGGAYLKVPRKKKVWCASLRTGIYTESGLVGV